MYILKISADNITNQGGEFNEQSEQEEPTEQEPAELRRQENPEAAERPEQEKRRITFASGKPRFSQGLPLVFC